MPLGVDDNLIGLAPRDPGLEAGHRVQPARGVRRHRDLRSARRRLSRAHASAVHRAAIRAACCSRGTRCCPSSCSPITACRPRSSWCSRAAGRRDCRSACAFPLFVKSSTEDASLGIAHASVVTDERGLKERIAFIHEQTHSDALVEEYIEGRELYVGVIGNERLKVLARVGDDVRLAPAGPSDHRHPQGEMGPQLSAEVRHHHRGGGGPARGRPRAARAAVTAHLSRFALDRLRAHGFPS